MFLSFFFGDQRPHPRHTKLTSVLAFLVLVSMLAPAAWAEGITYRDIANDPASGLAYDRGPSESDGVFAPYISAGTFFLFDIPLTPLKSRGAPGTAIFDFDGDGDLDIYVTNGPGRANSLYSNQLRETGATRFVDVAAAAGVEARDQDSSGVCFGDTDNDGDRDLFVLSNFVENRFFENNGDGTFDETTAASGFAGVERSSVGCSFGDIDGDGLLDVAIANCCEDMSNQFSTGGVDEFAFNQANQVYLNRGGNSFEDVTSTSGILDLAGVPPGVDTITWALALVDFDHDGDLDLLTADDQANVPFTVDGGIDRGYLQLFANDGSGQFTNISGPAGLLTAGWWMGLSFGDVNGDGKVDFFGSNFGDYGITLLSPLDPVYGDFVNYTQGSGTSRWFLNNGDGTFADPGVGDLEATPFGWGTSMVDYDNDADTDIIYHGGLNPGNIVQTAPGVILENNGSAGFWRDEAALAGSTEHELRTVQGVAVGDLNQDGFADVVSVSNFDIPRDAALATYNVDWDSPFDFGRYLQWFAPTDTPFLTAYSGVELENGSLSVELSSGDNGNRWFEVRPRGTVDLPTVGGKSNRDGIGAIVTVETLYGARTARPVMGGASYASQDSLELGFGLGAAPWAKVDILWPGGTRNRLYGARHRERLDLPEIPCSIDTLEPFYQYLSCVAGSLVELRRQGVVSRRMKGRLFVSALIAYFDEH